jgi:peptidoglycan hydrolase-like protein with peptidoglycan-binding domain
MIKQLLPESYQFIIGFITSLGFNIDNSKNQMNILGLQGISINEVDNLLVPFSLNSNDPNKYNDVIIIFRRPEEVWALLGSIDPGNYYTQNPMSRLGCAHLVFTQHVYTTGLHQGKYRALRLFNEKGYIYKDFDKDYNPDPNEKIEIAEGSGINIHAGGSGPEIGKWSAGCQIIWGGWEGTPYKKLIEWAYQDSPTHKFFYTLWRGKDFLRYTTHPEVFKPTLQLACISPMVSKIQERLGLKADGIFGKGTYEAIVSFQKSKNLIADGVVGAKTWEALNV